MVTRMRACLVRGYMFDRASIDGRNKSGALWSGIES